MSSMTTPKTKGRKRGSADVFVVIGEGASETLYFSAISRLFPGISVHVCDAKGGDVRNMKRAIARESSKCGRNDRIAAVIDVDEKTCQEIDEFESWCHKNKVDLFVSNPSFEVFLLMHYQNVPSSLTQKDLEETISIKSGRKYDKGRGIPLSEDSVKNAIRRAQASVSGARTAKEIAGKPGTTTAHRLVMEITGINERFLVKNKRLAMTWNPAAYRI